MAALALPAVRHLPAALIPLACTYVVLCWFPAPALAVEPGQWTPLQPLGGEAIHMALLPDPEVGYPNHSRLVWWQNRTVGNVLRWPRPAGPEDCTNFPYLPPIGTWNPGAEIFCSGHVPMDGNLATFGGTSDIFPWGTTDARSYDPVTGSWIPRPRMAQARWYATSTVLRDSRVMVAAGNKGEQLCLAWGRRDGAWPSGTDGDQVHRFGRETERTPSDNGYWDPSVIPQADGTDRPPPREGHTVELLLDPFQSNPDVRAQFFFGGRDAAGDPVANELWVLRRETGGALDLDYTYQWKKLTVEGVAAPLPRSEHTAVRRSSTEMFIFGGLKKAGGVETPTNELWRMYRDPANPTQWFWEQINVAGAPSARWGHGAAYQRAGETGPGGWSWGERMLVFGGAETAPGAGGALAENRIWAYEFASQTWSEVLTLATRPPARRDHVMITDSLQGAFPPGAGILVHGGYLGPNPPPETLWQLVPDSATDYWQWSEVGGVTGTPPGPRWGHSATWDTYSGDVVLDPADRRLFVFGGMTGDPPVPADKKVYMIEPFGDRTWYPSLEAPFSLSGHTADLDPYGVLYARTPEIYDPQNGWTQHPATAWNQLYYPLHFVVPGNPTGGGRVVAVGSSDPQARYLDIPASGSAGSWQTVGTAGSGHSGFRATSGVMYEPGKILIAGGVNLGVDLVVGTSKTLDANTVTNDWLDTVDPPMAPRLQHNLVLLPTGEVLAVGGVTEIGDGSTTAQHCPQLWSPVSRSWTEIGDLACDLDGIASPRCPVPPCPVVRNYHSTAVLLPNAKVVTAGGFGSNPYRLEARIFCPPYLFKPGVTPAQLAPRPVITSAPTQLTWGQVFTICTPDPAAVRKVALIRSGSTTHSFDQNQRYEQLAIRGTASDPPRLFVAAPASPDQAPPGDYLLFLVGSSDASGSYPEAPSIAEWVRLQGPLGTDLCDIVPPGTITDLTPDVVGPNEIWFFWTATADDGVLPASGSEQLFDLRASAGPIDSETAWTGAPYLAQDESVPGPFGTWGTGHVGGLTPCTWYHFAVRAMDDNAWLSGFHAAVTCQTFDIGCGGGGFSAREARGEADGAAASLATQPASATGLEPATDALVVETRRTEDGAWQVLLRFANATDGVDSTAQGIAVEQETGQGERATLGRIAPDESQGLLGIGSLRERGRLVIPGAYRLEQVMARLRHRAQDYLLDAAQHSRLGALAGDFLSGGGSPDLGPGDWLSLRYVPVAEPLSDARSWYLVVRRAGSGGPIPMASRPGVDGASRPARYALRASEPNPAAGPTLVRFDLPVAGTVQLEVFDLLGRRVATLAQGVYPAGSHARVWDLRGADGTPVRPGVYVYPNFASSSTISASFEPAIAGSGWRYASV